MATLSKIRVATCQNKNIKNCQKFELPPGQNKKVAALPKIPTGWQHCFLPSHIYTTARESRTTESRIIKSRKIVQYSTIFRDFIIRDSVVRDSVIRDFVIRDFVFRDFVFGILYS